MGHLQPISSSSYSWEFPELYQVYDAEGLSETFVALCLGRVKAPAGVRSPMCLSFENFLLDLGWQGGVCPLRPSFQGTDTSSEVDLGFPMSLPEFPVGGSVFPQFANSGNIARVFGCWIQWLSLAQLIPAHPAYKPPSPYPSLAEAWPYLPCHLPGAAFPSRWCVDTEILTVVNFRSSMNPLSLPD